MAASNYTLNKETGCFNWNGYIDPDGYGQTHVDGKTTVAHRHFFEQENGQIPKGMVIDHLCKNRQCVNPAHMEVVTNQVNVQRGRSAKLTKENVLQIRALSASGSKQTSIAELFGIGQDQVSRIINRKRWQNV